MSAGGPSHGGLREHSQFVIMCWEQLENSGVTTKLLFSWSQDLRTTLTLGYSGMNLVFLEMKIVNGH